MILQANELCFPQDLKTAKKQLDTVINIIDVVLADENAVGAK